MLILAFFYAYLNFGPKYFGSFKEMIVSIYLIFVTYV